MLLVKIYCPVKGDCKIFVCTWQPSWSRIYSRDFCKILREFCFCISTVKNKKIYSLFYASTFFHFSWSKINRFKHWKDSKLFLEKDRIFSNWILYKRCFRANRIEWNINTFTKWKTCFDVPVMWLLVIVTTTTMKIRKSMNY